MKNKLLRTILILAGLSLFSCLTFEAFHNSHEVTCQDENCPICLVVQIVRSAIRLSGGTVIHLFVKPIIISLFIIAVVTGAFKSITPVTQKIKMTT